VVIALPTRVPSESVSIEMLSGTRYVAPRVRRPRRNAPVSHVIRPPTPCDQNALDEAHGSGVAVPPAQLPLSSPVAESITAPPGEKIHDNFPLGKRVWIEEKNVRRSETRSTGSPVV